MYTIYDYAYNGYLYLNNIMRPRHKRLSQLMIYAITACQSQCKHCNIWQKGSWAISSPFLFRVKHFARAIVHFESFPEFA